ncbi:uncharacterized protein J3R85_000423 [Psidium guajava]|nr:uncharacterized protein J3R85_000423 [Psidium guajava]
MERNNWRPPRRPQARLTLPDPARLELVGFKQGRAWDLPGPAEP